MNYAIEINHLSKQYKNADFYALKEVDLQIPIGSIFGLLGPNGAGKTTLVSILSGLMKHSSGDYFVLGAKNDENAALIKSNIGSVPQDLAIYPTLTAYENLQYFGALWGIDKSELKARIESDLEKVGLFEFAHKRLDTFSGGMKRRINLLAGVLHRPKIVFLDEPTVGVDVHSKSKIIAYLRELNSLGTTIVYTSHHLAEAQDFCTHVAIIDHGKIVVCDKTSQLLAQDTQSTNLEDLFIAITGNELRDATKN